MAHLQKAGKARHIHNRESESVNSLIPSQLRANSQVFIAFLEDYYKYTNQVDQATNLIDRIQTEHDIDFTGDKFLSEIKKEIAKGIPESDVLNNRQLYRRIVDYYYTRGSEDSATVFFRLFFDDTVTINYPKETLFKTSDAPLISHGFIEDTGENIGESVEFSTITGDFVKPKNTQIDVGLKPIRVDVQNSSFNFIAGTYRYNSSNRRWEKSGAADGNQFFVYNRELNRWEFLRQVQNYVYAYDNRGIADEANPTLYAATEDEGFWSIFSDNDGANWSYRGSNQFSHPDYALIDDETDETFVPGTGDIRNNNIITGAGYPELGQPVSSGKEFTTETILTDSFKENEYFCHNSNLTSAFWTYDYDQMESTNSLMVDLEFIQEKENLVKYPLTYQVRDNNSSSTYGHMFVNETNFGVKGVNPGDVTDPTALGTTSNLSRRLRIDIPANRFIKGKKYILSGTITFLPGQLSRGFTNNASTSRAAGCVFYSSTSQGFDLTGGGTSAVISDSTFITLPDDDANGVRGLALSYGKSEVGDFEIELERNDDATVAIMLVSGQATEWQIDNLRLVERDPGDARLGDNDIREVCYHEDYDRYKQLGFSFLSGDHQSGLKTAYRSLPFNNVTDTHKIEASAIMANSGSSVTEGIRIHKEINMLRNVTFFDIIDDGDLTNGRPRSARSSTTISTKEPGESSYKIERDFHSADINESNFDVTDATPPEITVDNKVGTLEVGMGVAGSQIIRGSKIESISAQDSTTATFTISPQFTNVVKVLTVGGSNLVHNVQIISGATETLAGTIGTDLYIEESGTAIGGTPTVTVSNVVNDNGTITCDITFDSAQSLSVNDELKFVKKHTIQDDTVLNFTDVQISLALQRSAITYDAGDGLRTYLTGYHQKQIAVGRQNVVDHNPFDTFELATIENDTEIFAKDKDGNISTLVKAATPTRYTSFIGQDVATKISIPDRTLLSSNGKGFGIASRMHDNAVLPLNAYGKDFLTFNSRSNHNTYLTGYALESGTVDFYEIEIQPARGWANPSTSFNKWGQRLFEFGPYSPPTDTVIGPAETLKSPRKVDDFATDATIKSSYKYEVLTEGDYSGAIDEYTGFITRNGKKISNSERTNLLVGDIFVAQPGPTGKHKFQNGQLVKMAPAESITVKEGQYFSLTPRSGASYRYAFSDEDDRTPDANRYYFYVVISTGNIVLGQQGEHHTVDNLVITPSSTKGLHRKAETSTVYNYSLQGLRSPLQSGNGRVSDGPQIQSAENIQNYTYTETFTIDRAKATFDADVTNSTTAVLSSSGATSHEGNPTSAYGTTNVGPLYTNQYLRVAVADLNGAIDSTAGDTINIDNVKGHIPNGCRVDLATSDVISQGDNTTPITVASVTQTNAGGSGDTATITLSQDLEADDNKRLEFYVQITNIADRGTATSDSNEVNSATITTDIGITTTGNANGTLSSSIFRLGLRKGGLVANDANRFAFKSTKAPLFTTGGKKVTGMHFKESGGAYGAGITHTALEHYGNARLYLDNALTDKEDSEELDWVVEVDSAAVLNLPGTINYVYSYENGNRLGTVKQLGYANNYNPNDDKVNFAQHPTSGIQWYQTSARAASQSTNNSGDNPKVVQLSLVNENIKDGKIKVGQEVTSSLSNVPAGAVVSKVYHQYKIEITVPEGTSAAYDIGSGEILTFRAPTETYTNTNPNSSDRSAAYMQVSGELAPVDGHYFESHLPIMAQSYADGSGSDGEHYMPLEKCKDTYVIPHPLGDWSIVTTYANTVKVYFWNSEASTPQWKLFQNITLNDTSANAAQTHFYPTPGTPGSGLETNIVDPDNTSFTPTIWKFEGTKPFALWTNDEEADEELVFGFNQNTYNGDIEYNFFSQYENRKGRLSDVNKLHDGEFNQEFSYGINTGVSLDRWETPYRKLVHPAGLKFFALLGVEPQALRTSNGSSIYDLTTGGNWVNNLDLPIGQHSPTFQPGWLDELFTSIVEIEPHVLVGAQIDESVLDQILASTYVLSSSETNGITTITLTTKFVETLTNVRMLTTDLSSFTRPNSINTNHWAETGIDALINQGLTGNDTRSDLNITIDETRVDENNQPAKPFNSILLKQDGGVTGGRELEFETPDTGDDIIRFKLLDNNATSTRAFELRNYGLRSGRKYKISGSYKVTENTLDIAATIGVDISDGYVQENEPTPPAPANGADKGKFRASISAGQTNSTFTAFECTGTYWHFVDRNSIGRNNVPGVNDFIDFGVFTGSGAHSGKITVEFKNFKIEEFYPEDEQVLFTNTFDTRVPKHSTNPGTERVASFTNFTSWHNPISNLASEDFENYQPLDVPDGVNIKTEVINLKPVSQNDTILWSADAAEDLYNEADGAFPTEVNFTFN